jgi:gliding motility-associated-like protein
MFLKSSVFSIFYFCSCICFGQTKISLSNQPNKSKPLTSCNNWLGLPSTPSFITVGDLDVPGNQITVEALFNRTTPYTGGTTFAGDVVSKHKDPWNVNYLLRPNSAEINAGGIYYITPPVCDIELNKTYHIAMVYDGATLKFYRNGFLLSQIAASGDLFQNDYLTEIGYYQAQLYPTNFIGYINEVRIWNVARTQAQIQTYMNTSLPSPATQTGLLAYYTFDDLTNKQGNSVWNGTLEGNAVDNQINPTCSSFVADNVCCPVLSGNLTGNSICLGESPTLIFHPSIATIAPYTLVYSYAGNNYTVSNVQDGVPFPVAGETLTSGTSLGYTLVSIQDGSGCATTAISGVTATIVVNDCMPCTNWLGLPGQPSFADVGDVSVGGNQLTVEALINRTVAYTSNTPEEGDVVSKNRSTTDINYLLRPNHAFISTTDGNFATPDICDISLHKTYHVAMVYDGATLKFFRNGYLMSQVPATGNLIQSGGRTTIGYNSNQTGNENFLGYINEVKIWNLARTQAQIQAFMNAPVSSPSTQPGLLAYYRFNSLANQQGNPGYNAVLGGSALSSAININCTFVPDHQCCRTIDGVLLGNAICAGQLPMLSFKPTGTFIPPFELSYSDGFYTYTQTDVQPDVFFQVPAVLNSNTTYHITKITDAGECADEKNNATATVIVNQPVNFVMTADTTICKNASVQLFVTGGSGYSWSPAELLSDPNMPNPLTHAIAENTKFYVSGSDANHCDVKDSVQINVQPKPVFHAPEDQTICKGQALTINGNNSPDDIYSWSPATAFQDANSSSPTVTPDVSAVYQLHIVNAHCSLYDSVFDIHITVNPSPEISIQKSNDINCTTISAKLTASGAYSYSWTPAEGLSDPHISSPAVTISKTTTFIVEAKNPQGCAVFDSVTVSVSKTGENAYAVPNAFTPNNDHINDCFGIHSWGQVNIEEFSVFNRWGQRVFYTRDPSACWDGTFQGEKQESGTFVYIIKASSFCGDVSRKGTVLLIR